MGYNIVVSGHPKSIGIPRVDGLSTGPPDLVSQLGIRVTVYELPGTQCLIQASQLGIRA